MTGFIDIGALEDVPRQGARLVRTAQGCIAVFRTLDDRVFAIDDRCPHQGGPLSDGLVHGDRVTCPLHNRVFDLNTGQALDPDEGRVRTFPVRVRDSRIQISAELLTHRAAAHPHHDDCAAPVAVPAE